jgi:hypothetical protein
MAELTIEASAADSLAGARRERTVGLAPGLQHIPHVTIRGRGETDMRSIDAVVSDLEWQRLRRRMVMHPAEALFLNCGTWAVIAVLKLVTR